MKFNLQFLARLFIGIALVAILVMVPPTLVNNDVVPLHMGFALTFFMVVPCFLWWWYQFIKWAALELYYQDNPKERPRK